MATGDFKVTAADLEGKLISELSDRPNDEGLTPDELKARFDAALVEGLLPRFNAFLDALDSDYIGESGAHMIASAGITGLAGGTVYDQLVALKGQIDSIVAGTLPEGTVTDSMLDSASTALKARAEKHIADRIGNIRILGAVSGNGETYTMADSDVYFDNSNPDQGMVPYEGQEANLFWIAQWWENGEQNILMECEYDSTL